MSMSKTEPVHSGKPLNYWARFALDQNPDCSPSSQAREAIEAIRLIGPKAIPFLLAWLQPPWRDSILPSGAVASFTALGLQATSAIPELPQLLEKYKPPHSMDAYGAWRNVVEALSYLGPEALPVLLNAAKNFPPEHVQWELIQSLGNFGVHGVPAIPALIAWTRDPNSWVR